MPFTKISAKKFSPAIFELKGISKKTVEQHLKLYQAYVNKYNEIREKLDQLKDDDFTKANQVYSPLRELKVEMSFAWGGVINHEIYFSHLVGSTSNGPTGDLLKQIVKDFGSFDRFKTEMKASGISARGWVWTGWNEKENSLFNYVGDTQNTYLNWYVKPIIALDTYEHAYFIDYGVNRGSYIDAFFANLNWDIVQNNFAQAINNKL